MGYFFVVAIGLGVLFFVQYSDTTESIVGSESINQIQDNKSNSVENIVANSTENSVGSSDVIFTGAEQRNPVENIISVSTGMIVHDVPFTSQAPFGAWGNIIFQEGCEEAATIMAIAWATGKTEISPEDANAQILAIADYEQEEFGTHMHASIYDISTTMTEYLGFSDHTIVENISKAELIQYLRDGHIVMVPTSGRALKNSYYTPPGPRNHIILIIGYDPDKSEFITNDSGTKNGALYRYNEDLLFSAIGYYATSATDAGSPIDTTRKSGIVISKVAS